MSAITFPVTSFLSPPFFPFLAVPLLRRASRAATFLLISVTGIRGMWWAPRDVVVLLRFRLEGLAAALRAHQNLAVPCNLGTTLRATLRGLLLERFLVYVFLHAELVHGLLLHARCPAARSPHGHVEWDSLLEVHTVPHRSGGTTAPKRSALAVA